MEEDAEEKIVQLEAANRILEKKLKVSIEARVRLEKFKEINQTFFENLNSELTTTLEKLKETQKALHKAKEEAEFANKIKSGFVANMSHELRTPLNAIIGYTELLMEEAEDDNNELLIQDLRKIEGSAHHLLSLINDVLDLSKIEAGRIEVFLESVSIKKLLDDIATMINPMLAKNDNGLIVNMSPAVDTIYTDFIKLRQNLLNLLSNASKFTKNGTITLSVAPLIKDNTNWVEFKVSDTGKGISPKEMTRLFHAFTQADASTTRKYGGTGLGLYLTKQFTEMLGGWISVESVENEGSTFTIILPLQSKAPVESQKPKPTTQEIPVANRSQQILVIDDDPGIHEKITEEFSKFPFEILHAFNGEEGLNLAKTHRPAVIILDVIMPIMDGWTTLSKIKTDPSLCAIPVVLVTVANEEELGYALGAIDYFPKPADMKALMDRIEQIVFPDNGMKRVLIVDDNSIHRRVMSSGLRQQGWTTYEAHNGVEALERVKEQRPELILLDLLMPIMDGYGVMNALQQDEALKDIPVIVITAKDLSNEEQDQLKKYSKLILQKGVLTNKELITTICSQVQRLVVTTEEHNGH